MIRTVWRIGFTTPLRQMPGGPADRVGGSAGVGNCTREEAVFPIRNSCGAMPAEFGLSPEREQGGERARPLGVLTVLVIRVRVGSEPVPRSRADRLQVGCACPFGTCLSSDRKLLCRHAHGRGIGLSVRACSPRRVAGVRSRIQSHRNTGKLA